MSANLSMAVVLTKKEKKVKVINSTITKLQLPMRITIICLLNNNTKVCDRTNNFIILRASMGLSI